MAKYRLIPNRQGGVTILVTAGHGGLVHHREVRVVRDATEASNAMEEMAKNVQKWRDSSTGRAG